MPGSTPHQAVTRFVGTLTHALSCVQPVKLLVSRDGYRAVGQPHGVASEDVIRLRCGGGTFLLSVRLIYVIIERRAERRAERFKVSTQRYQHAITEEQSGSELIAWHWHPGTSTPEVPHIHVTGAEGSPVERKGHIPSGRVTVEAVVRYALGELGCKARRRDWADVLDKCEGDFRTFATWGSRQPH